MKNRKLATRYARALLSALHDPQAAANADTFLTCLASAMNESVELRVSLLNPAVPSAARKKALQALSDSTNAGPAMGNFLATVVDNHRVGELPSIAEAFHEVREAAAGVIPATVTSARPLDEAMRRRLQVSLERLTGRKVHATWETDESLVGGVVTRVGSKVYDGSLKTQLVGLRRRMVKE